MIANSFSHFPNFCLICPCKYHHHQPLQHHLCWNTAQNRPPVHFTVRASSIENSTSRRRKKVKSNAELCDEIREFLIAAGFPVGHVPSMKELSEHGRNDLANIVRRRGYKLVRELLANSIQTDVDKSNTDAISTEKQDETDNHEDKLAGQNGKLDDFSHELLLPTEVSIMENHAGTLNIDQQLEANNDSLLTKSSLMDLSFEGNALYHVKGHVEDIETMVDYKSPSSELSIMDNLHCSSKIDSHLKSDVDFHAPQETSASPCIGERPMESLTDMYLKEKVANFIQNGELDMDEDNIDGLLKDSGAEESICVEESEKEMESQSKIPSEKNAKDTHSRRHVALASKESTLTMRDDRSSTEGLPAVDTDQARDVETSKRDNQTEIDRLKFMLHQKELELSMLKEQIEKEKLALTVLQANTDTEINKAQKLIPDKDAELHSAEEGLSGLEEVEIHYCGDGEIVEVTGSFNGWHHRIKMDPQLSSSNMDPIESRTFRVWSTVLWLYPGIYEIKFVVDGQWKVDPQRESVTKGGICNNVIRVKR